MSGHVVPTRVYYAIFAILMIFTALTVAAAVIDLGALNTPVALGIAVVKATLVILYFMHVRYNPRLICLVVGTGFAWLGILIVITFSDYISRGWIPFPGK